MNGGHAYFLMLGFFAGMSFCSGLGWLLGW
jgi:hypothetical protein